MADLQLLMDMGFPKEKAERALQVTNNKGVEPAMEWLLAHVDEDIPPQNQPSTASEAPSGENIPASSETAVNPEAVSTAAATLTEPPQAKSIKCDECNKLFKSQDEVEFHAAKTNHSSFSESTDEKKPLSEDERKAQLALLEEKMKKKRLEREENDKKEALERERLRIKSGKDMLEAKRRMEEQEMMKIMDQRKREKQEEKLARERVKAQIEADKAARKAKQTGIETPPSPAPQAATVSSSTTPQAPNKTYTSTRIQVRMQDGSALTETFDVKEQLAAVRLFVQLKFGANPPAFGLMTNFPKKVFSDEDYDTPLDKLGLVPSAVLIVTKPNNY